MRRKQRGAMRNVFWFLGLAALAVALALLVGNNAATFTLFWPPHRFDVSFNFALFALIAAFVLLHLALRALAALRELPRRAQRWPRPARAAVAAAWSTAPTTRNRALFGARLFSRYALRSSMVRAATELSVPSAPRDRMWSGP
jgi:hypothetical protein